MLNKYGLLSKSSIISSIDSLLFNLFSIYLFISNDSKINMVNYRKLFIGNKKFEKSYGKTKQEILEEYNYEKYMEEKKNGRTL